MSKSRKYRKQQLKLDEISKLRDKYVFKPQPFERPPKESNRYFRVLHYMLMNKNFCNLSSNAVVVYLYMRDWVYDSKDYLENQVFPFSTGMITSIRNMSKPTVIKALKELEYYGFIKRESNACFQSGYTQCWSFPTEWFQGDKKPLHTRKKKPP